MKFKDVTQPTPMAVPIAINGDKNILPLNDTKTNLASLQKGFPEITQKSADEGGLPPVRADFNGMFYLSTDQRTYLQNGGIITFSQAVSDKIVGYPKGAILDFVDVVAHSYTKVMSLIDDNTYNFVEDSSLIDGTHWVELTLGSGGGGLELGTIICLPFGVDESENKYRYLNGQVIIQTQYPAFTAKVKKWQETRSSLFTTETNWQAEKTASVLGQCGKFVIDDEAGTIRLPLVININGLSDLANCGGIKAQSLPNITATWGSAYEESNAGWTSSGAVASLIQSGYWMEIPGNSAENYVRRNFNANYSNNTYKDGAPVQQEAIQYPYAICVNTGVEEAERPINDYTVNNPYSYGMSQYYQGDMNNNSWLKSDGQFKDGGVYNGMYEWCLAQLTAGVDGFKASTDTYGDSDFVINTTDTTFRLPIIGMVSQIGPRVLVESKQATTSDPTWYNVYSDGWCEQGGFINGFPKTVTFSKPYIDNNYTINISANSNTTGWTCAYVNSRSATSFYADGTGTLLNADRNITASWLAQGYIDRSNINTDYNLYYYCGDTLQNVDLINIARMQEQITDINAPTRGYLVESYVNGQSGYRLYSDGFCEQWGYSNTDTNSLRTVTFLKPYKDTNYAVTLGASNIDDNNTNTRIVKIASITTTNMVTTGVFNNSILTDFHFYWRTLGYVA